jgi:hypothetical protein
LIWIVKETGSPIGFEEQKALLAVLPAMDRFESCPREGERHRRFG